VQITKAQKDTDGLTVFLNFWDLSKLKLSVIMLVKLTHRVNFYQHAYGKLLLVQMFWYSITISLTYIYAQFHSLLLAYFKRTLKYFGRTLRPNFMLNTLRHAPFVKEFL